jgi:hypothetical protein
MKTRFLALLAFSLIATFADDVAANSVTNGGFETPVIGGNFTTFALGSTAITGWTVISGASDPGSGSVDLLSGFQTPHSGAQSIDLDGSPGFGASFAGGISQTLTGLTPNANYTLDFFYSNNPNGSSSSAMVTVGNLSTIITHSGSGFGTPNYTEATFTFTASSATQVLSFSSTDSASSVNGIILDDVSVNASAAVPEPASLGMLLLGLGTVGLVAVRWRRRTA